VIAIGGGASTGKTTLAASLAVRLGLSPIAHVDDLVPSLEAAQGPNFTAADRALAALGLTPT
jgi:uridine kinase